MNKEEKFFNKTMRSTVFRIWLGKSLTGKFKFIPIFLDLHVCYWSKHGFFFILDTLDNTNPPVELNVSQHSLPFFGVQRGLARDIFSTRILTANHWIQWQCRC